MSDDQRDEDRTKAAFVTVIIVCVLTMVVAVLLIGVLTGCAASRVSEPKEPPTIGEAGYTDYLSEAKIKLSDGRLLTCVILDGTDEAGLSCDWQGAKGTK